MRAVPCRCVQVLGALLLVSLCFGRTGPAAAQEATPTGVSGDAYTSPTFGYRVTWDGAVWSVGDESSQNGYDSLQLTTKSSKLYLEGMYFYRGDPAACLDGERLRTADENKLADLTPAVDAGGQPAVGQAVGSAHGVYRLVPTAGDGTTFDGFVYITCRTVLPGAAVLVITAFVPAGDDGTDAQSVEAVIASFASGTSATSSFGASDLERLMAQAGQDIDRYWEGVFAAAGDSYVNPTFGTFTGPADMTCDGVSSVEDGPFYCDGTHTVYLDPAEVGKEFLPSGVLMVQVMMAHEVGHHVQALLGLKGCTATVCGAPGSSLAIELQAECFAGAWTKDAAARGAIKSNDVTRVESAVKAFFGDPSGTPSDHPDAHGSGEAQVAMFEAGYQGGPSACGLK